MSTLHLLMLVILGTYFCHTSGVFTQVINHSSECLHFLPFVLGVVSWSMLFYFSLIRFHTISGEDLTKMGQMKT